MKTRYILASTFLWFATPVWAECDHSQTYHEWTQEHRAREREQEEDRHNRQEERELRELNRREDRELKELRREHKERKYHEQTR